MVYTAVGGDLLQGFLIIKIRFLYHVKGGWSWTPYPAKGVVQVNVGKFVTLRLVFILCETLFYIAVRKTFFRVSYFYTTV